GRARDDEPGGHHGRAHAGAAERVPTAVRGGRIGGGAGASLHRYLVHRRAVAPGNSPAGNPLGITTPGPVWVWVPFVLLVAERGVGAATLAVPTCPPAESPEVIPVHVLPTAPTFTVRVRAVSPTTTCTVWRVPSVVTAEVGTATSALAAFVTIEIEPVEPL